MKWRDLTLGLLIRLVVSFWISCSKLRPEQDSKSLPVTVRGHSDLKHIICKQNSEEWYRERLGKPTASEFDRIITKAGALSGQRFDYMYQLIYEKVFRKRANIIKPTFWMWRGNVLESAASIMCENMLDCNLKEVGLYTTDCGRLACSPDRIVDAAHAVEIKCPKPWQHMQYTVMGPQADYFQQLHGIMWVGGFEKISFFSYCPGMPCRIHTIDRDDKLMQRYDEVLPSFADELAEHERIVRDMGAYYDIDATMGLAKAWEGEAN